MSPEQRRLMELHDGELDPAVKDAVEAEIRVNPSARGQLRSLVLLGDLVREVESSRAAPPDLGDAILARTVGKPASSPRSMPRRPWQRFAPAAGVLALAASAAVVISSSRRTEPTASAVPVASVQRPTGSVAVAALPAEAAEAGVSIQSVDFGTTQGAIFLVPGGQSETMVVWTLEDANDKG